MGNTCTKDSSPTNSSYTYRGKTSARIPKDATRISIHSSVRKVSAGSFRYCPSIQTIDVPPSLRAIENEAFNGCTNLIEIRIPNAVKSIGERAFYKCISLQTIHIDASSSTIETIGDEAFLDCKSLKSIKLPATLNAIGRYAFYGCRELESVSIHQRSKLKSINACTFGDCTALKNVELPKTIKVIKQNAFYGCKSLRKFTLPQETTTICSDTFYGCESLTHVYVPPHVSSLNLSAFQHCSGLQYINIHSAGIDRNNCMYPFQGCSSLVSVALPSIDQIGMFAFKGELGNNMCMRKTSFLLSVFLRNITFFLTSFLNIGCVSLVSIYIPPSVTSISDGAFTGCVSLSTIILPEPISVGANAFRNCSILNHCFKQSSYYNPRDLNIFDDFIRFLQNRFDQYPIHQYCYHYPDSGTFEDVRRIILGRNEPNLQALSPSSITSSSSFTTNYYITKDGLYMNPLHVLASNPYASLDAIVRVFKLFNTKQQKHILSKKMQMLHNDETYDPLQLYLKSRGMASVSLSQALNVPVGMPWLLIKKWILPQLVVDESSFGCEEGVDGDNSAKSTTDRSDNGKKIYPFMIAAKQKNCDLETVYNLAMCSVEVVSMWRNTS